MKSRKKPKLTQRMQNFIGKEIKRQIREGKPQKQAIAIAFSKAKKKFGNSRLEKEMNNPNGKSKKGFRNLLVTLFGLAIALQILRRIRTR